MADKSASKYLLYLEKHLANQNPALLEASRVYHELDQIAYDLGLIDMDESTASKISWWPIITVFGTATAGAEKFINQYLKSDVLDADRQLPRNKFTILHYSSKELPVTLPGTALDGDTRFPFYQISHKIDQVKKGEGSHINTYLEMKTANCQALQGKLIVVAPNFTIEAQNPVIDYLNQFIVQTSDLVLVFFDAAKPDLEDLRESLSRFINEAVRDQDLNKILFVINQKGTAANPADPEIWKRQLQEFGLDSGQFVVLQDAPEQNKLIAQMSGSYQAGTSNDAELKKIHQRIEHINVESAYRILNSLEHSIDEIDDQVIPEVQKAITTWKERSNFTSGLILSFFVFLIVIGEISGFGLLDLFLDPFLAPISIAVIVAMMVPIHLLVSRMQAKFIIKDLEKKKKEQGLLENLAGLFEKSLTFWRILLPIKEPVGWTKQTRMQLLKLKDRAKELVQSLNDNFSAIDVRSKPDRGLES